VVWGVRRLVCQDEVFAERIVALSVVYTDCTAAN
jgi:hypothetical protein